MKRRSCSHSEAGYSLIELLVSSAIMLVVTGAIFGLVTPSQGMSQAQPEVSDLQQRLRVGTDSLFKELMMAGAGTYRGPDDAALVNFFAPLLPRRVGQLNQDGPAVFRPDAITITYVPSTFSQTTISDGMPDVSAELKVNTMNNCPEEQRVCGFKEGMDVIIFDTSGNFDVFTITEVQTAAAHIQHRNQNLSVAYQIGASVAQVESNTLYFCRPNVGIANPSNTPVCPDDPNAWQLRRYDGNVTDVPLADNVVDLQFQYFGDPNPPVSPRPPLGTANCLYDAAGNLVLPVLPRTDGSLAALPGAMLSDGPFCGGGANQYDADLLRVRKVRVSIRMQVASPALRAQSPLFWRNPGTSPGAERAVPDYAVSFEVTPRNMNLAR